ncbi:MAG: GTP-binding protein [Pirellulaceae bacterium]
MKRNIENLRNIGIIAHIDAGKTTVTERMLFLSGVKHKVGRVDFGTTTTDDNAEEQERGITIYSACVTFPWKQIQVNLLDTPGHVDFTAEVERCLRVLDGAVVVFSAREGVEAQSETVWRQADKYHVPRVAFINKMDREGADFERVLGQIRDRLQANPVPIEIPLGQGPPHVNDPFRGVIDLVRMKLLTYNLESEGREFEVHELPEEAQLEAESWREQMLEALYDHSPEIMELALSEEPIPEELLIQTLREATIARKIQPVLCGSALHGVGVQPLLDAVSAFLPDGERLSTRQGIRSDGQKGNRDHPQSVRRGAVLRIGVQDLAGEDGRPVLGSRLLGRAQGQFAGPGAEYEQEGERRPALANPCDSQGA